MGSDAPGMRQARLPIRACVSRQLKWHESGRQQQVQRHWCGAQPPPPLLLPVASVCSLYEPPRSPGTRVTSGLKVTTVQYPRSALRSRTSCIPYKKYINISVYMLYAPLRTARIDVDVIAQIQQLLIALLYTGKCGSISAASPAASRARHCSIAAAAHLVSSAVPALETAAGWGMRPAELHQWQAAGLPKACSLNTPCVR
jgi:hypothetical protein